MASLSSTPSRPLPNILITGTPGTGKTTLSQSLAEELSFTHLEVSAFVKQHSLHEGVDAEFDSVILDEDKLVDALEPLVAGGGQVVDFHSPEVFPERYFDLVLVLRSSTEALYDRLTERGYKENKRDENVTAEIMQVVLEEARESYAEEIVHEVRSDTVEEMDANVERVKAWVGQWKADNKQAS
jgi:adenylate kinase